MSGVLLDTHVWIWFLQGSDQLPPGLRRAVEEAPGNGWLSPISVWELGLLADRGRVRLGVPLREWVPRSRTVLPLREAPVNVEVALAADEVERTVTDPADRFIAATGRVYELTLLTVDHRLKGLRGVRTRSR